MAVAKLKRKSFVTSESDAWWEAVSTGIFCCAEFRILQHRTPDQSTESEFSVPLAIRSARHMTGGAF